MTETEFQAMRQAVIDGDADAAEAAAKAAIAAGIPPLVAIDEGFMPGMKEVGAGFAAGDLFLPDMMLAARAMQRALGVLEPELKAAAVERTVAGRVVIGTVAGDIHEIGKNLVGMLLSTSGFEVHDLGRQRGAGALRRGRARAPRRHRRPLRAPDDHHDRPARRHRRPRPRPASVRPSR